MGFLYILPWSRKNVFKRALRCSVRIGFGSGYSAAVPGLFPGYLRQAALLVFYLALVHQIMPGGVASMDSRWRSVSDRLAVPGMVPGWARIPRKCMTSQKLHQNRVGLNRGNLKKNRRNLRLIQTCDFFYFVHSVHNFL